MNGLEAVLISMNEWARGRFDMNDWAKGRRIQMNWARGRLMCLELQSLDLCTYIYILDRNMNWALGRLLYIVLSYLLYSILFTGLSLTIYIVYVGECA